MTAALALEPMPTSWPDLTVLRAEEARLELALAAAQARTAVLLGHDMTPIDRRARYAA